VANLRIGRRSGLGLRGGGRRRLTEWFPSADVTAVTALPAANAILSQSLVTTELARRPFTVVRVRGLIHVESDQTGANEIPFGALGFAVVTDQAIAAGGAALPTPITAEGSDKWFVWVPFVVSQLAGTGGNIFGMNFDFDSKAMRKVQEGEDIAVMVENASALHGLSFIIKFRLLVKLH